MSIRYLAITSLLAFSPLLHAADAPGIDIYAGAYSWETEPSGEFASGGEAISMGDDLGYGETRQNVLFIGLEHPVPLLPNVRLRQVDLSDSSSERLERSFTYDGTPFAVGQDVETFFQLDHTDLTLYYSPLDTVAKVDVGITARRLDAAFEIESSSPTPQEGAVAVEGTLPMLFLSVRGNLPLTGVYAGGELNAVSYDGSDLMDGRVNVGWRSDVGLGLELGYQQIDLELDDVDDLDADLEFGGPYLAVSLGF
jgi:outer membrane protein